MPKGSRDFPKMRFGVDFGSIWRRLSIDFRLILRSFLVDFATGLEAMDSRLFFGLALAFRGLLCFFVFAVARFGLPRPAFAYFHQIWFAFVRSALTFLSRFPFLAFQVVSYGKRS